MFKLGLVRASTSNHLRSKGVIALLKPTGYKVVFSDALYRQLSTKEREFLACRAIALAVMEHTVIDFRLCRYIIADSIALSQTRIPLHLAERASVKCLNTQMLFGSSHEVVKSWYRGWISLRFKVLWLLHPPF